MLMRSWIGGLRPRIGAIVLIHALLFAAAFHLVLHGADSRRSRIYLLPDPGHVALIVSAFERARPSTYADLARAFDDDRQQITLLAALPELPPAGGPADAEAERAGAPYRMALYGRPFRIEAHGRDVAGDLDNQPRLSRSPFRVIVGLSNGSAVEVRRNIVAPAGKVLTHLKLLSGLLLALDVLVVFWLAAQTTVPVERLVRAVRDDDPDRLVQPGPRELMELGGAFRDMRARLHAQIGERTRIIAAVAHDYRTYLTRLELRSDFIDDHEQRALALRDLEEMKLLLDDTLAFAQQDPETQGPETDGGDAALGIWEELARIADDRRRNMENVSLLGSDCGWQARVTPISFRRMLANLLDNALRYGGGHARILCAGRNGWIEVMVEDDGPGVPADKIELLAEPFLRLESSRARHTGGVGLGLSIVQALAHRFGGRLRLENRREGGLRAILSLPDGSSAR